MARTDTTDAARLRRWTVAAIGVLAILEAGDVALAKGEPPGRIERVRFEAGDSSTRVIIMLSRPIPFYVHVLGG